MSGFGGGSVGANAFLSSPHASKTIGPNPTTARGAGTVMASHPSQPRIIYPSGRSVVVRNVEDPSDCFIYRGHSATTTVAKFSPNGYWVASGDSTGKVRVWSWDNPEHLTKLETAVFAGGIADLDWDSESKKIVAVGEGSGMMAKVFLWDTGNSAGEMVGHTKRILSVAYKPSRPFRILTGGEDMKTIFYEGPPFKLNHSNNAVHTNFVNCVRYSADGTKLVSVGSDKKIQFYDGATGSPTTEIANAHAGTIYSVSFSPDGSKIITASADKTVKLFDVASLAEEATFTFSEDAQVGDMQIAALWTGAHMISLSLSGNINILNPASPALPARIIQAHQGSIVAMHLDKASNTLFSSSFDGVVCASDLASNTTRRVQGTDKRNLVGGAHGGKVVGLAIAAGELVSAGWDDSLRFASVASNAYHSEVALTGQPCALACSSSGLVVVTTNSEIALYRGQTKVGSLGSLGYAATCVAILNEEQLAVGGDDNKTHVYAIVDGGTSLTQITTLDTRSAVSAVAYSPSGDKLAVGDAGRQVEVFEQGSWSVLVRGKWVFHTSKVNCLSWSPSGELLASGAQDESIFIWNLAKPMSKVQLQFTHVGGVSGIEWLEENKIISSGADGVVVHWNVPPTP